MFKTIKTAEDVQAEQAYKAQAKVNLESLNYLSETDWYVIRKQETGVEIPADVLTKRQAARDRIVALEANNGV